MADVFDYPGPPLPGEPGDVISYDYTVWPAGTEVTLTTVPWDNNYRDIVKWRSASQLADYVRSRSYASVTVEKMTYCAFGQPVRINLSFSRVNKYNYIMVHNRDLKADNVDYFFYFITDIVYVAPNTTQVNVQLDVWSTYQYSVRFGQCYLERGHAGIAATNSWDMYGRTWLTVPEGMDIGNEYEIVNGNTVPLTLGGYNAKGKHFHEIDDIKEKARCADIVITSTVDIEQDAGTVTNPKMQAASGEITGPIVQGCDVFVMTVSAYKHVMSKLHETPWISQGIISAQMIPGGFIHWDKYSSSGGKFDDFKINGKKFPVLRAGTVADEFEKPQVKEVMPRFRSIDEIEEGRYKNLWKFYTYPYMVVELTMNNGAPLIVKPEMVCDTNLKVVELCYPFQPAPRIVFYPLNYGAVENATDPGDMPAVTEEGLDFVTGISNLPTLSIVNNSYISFMASNAHSMQYQMDSADWSQQKALRGADVAYNQATNAMSAASASTNLATNTASAQTALSNRTNTLSTGVNAAGNILTGLATSGPAGALSAAFGGVMSGINTAIQNDAANKSTAISNAAAQGQTAISNASAAYNRDTNRAYAQYSAQGDYANAIAGLNAKCQDAKLLQPSTSGQVGGDAFNLFIFGWQVTAKLKIINSGARKRIGEFWLRYGYAVNTPIKPPSDLMCMRNFTYWKFSETYLSAGDVPETFRQTIRGIFEKGVTVWRSPNIIGNIDWADNEPLPGKVTL